MTTDPSPFKPYRESLGATILRTGAIAIVLASILTLARLRRLPSTSADWFAWLVLLIFVAWISLGGHYVELFYLNILRPSLAHRSPTARIVVRLAVWLIGGSLLLLAAVTTRSLLLSGQFPSPAQAGRALLYGGPLFIAVELLAHTVLLLSRRPSFWNLRG